MGGWLSTNEGSVKAAPKRFIVIRQYLSLSPLIGKPDFDLAFTIVLYCDI